MASACGRPTPAVRCLPRGTLVQAWQGSVVELLRQVSTQELCLRILFVQCEELSRALAAISCRHITMGNMMTRLIAFALLSFAFAVPPAGAVVYCKTVGVPKGCVARPVGSAGVGAPGVGVVDPRHQPARCRRECWCTPGRRRCSRCGRRRPRHQPARSCRECRCTPGRCRRSWCGRSRPRHQPAGRCRECRRRSGGWTGQPRWPSGPRWPPLISRPPGARALVLL
jgi:hypothetical protein